MIIKGLQKLTLLDYPGKIASTIFVFGCNFRCYYCHNPELVLSSEAKKIETYSEKKIFNFLKERRDFLEGVCITGGEPCLNKELPEFIKKIKKLDYKIKLDTNGSNPEILKKLLKEKLIDYVAMDIKAPLEKYEKIINVKVDVEKIKSSIEIIKKSSIDYEFRTTILPELTSKQDLLEIAKMLKGAKAYFLQQFRPEKCLDKSFEKKKPYTEKEMLSFKKMLKPFFQRVEIRSETY